MTVTPIKTLADLERLSVLHLSRRKNKGVMDWDALKLVLEKSE